MICAYLDTDFTQLSREAKLISLALVSSDGREFYVELLDGWAPNDCSDFTRTIVLPQLDLGAHGMSFVEAGEALHAFISELGEVEIVGDALRWDWPLVTGLLANTGLPDNLRRIKEIDVSLLGEWLGDHPEPPHHALIDARILACYHSGTPIPESIFDTGKKTKES